MCGRLTQEYVVDGWASAEQDKLNWVRTHQQQLRADLYSGVVDAMQQGELQLGDIGQHIILPATFTGSLCSMFQLFQDSMAITRRFGHPTYFITMTANPNWPEINGPYPSPMTNRGGWPLCLGRISWQGETSSSVLHCPVVDGPWSMWSAQSKECVHGGWEMFQTLSQTLCTSDTHG